MRNSFGILLAACLLAASPVFAGNLTLENGQTTWTSTQCQKPVAEHDWTKVDPETKGDAMNSLSGKSTTWAGAMQDYINCLGAEADKDQTSVNQTIVASAQKLMNDARDEVNGKAPAKAPATNK